MAKGLLIVISGPSGTGKGTVIAELLRQRDIEAEISISCTTRSPRGSEVDGVNYFFKTEEDFQKMIEHEDFLEHAHVFGKYYGTPKTYVLDKLNAGRNVILEIDVQGAMQIKENFPEAVLIFIVPPSMDELYRRLSGRHTETADLIKKRYHMAKGEIEFARKYDFVVLNNTVAQAVEDIESIIRTVKMDPARTDIIQKLLKEGESK